MERLWVHQMFIVAVPLTIAFLHALLYLFDRRNRQNLYVAIVAASFAALALTDFDLVLPDESQWFLIPLMVLSVAAFVYSEFLPRQPFRLALFALFGVLVCILGWIEPRWGAIPGRLLVLAVILDTFRVAVLNWERRRSGSLLPAIGMTVFGITGAVEMLIDFQLLPSLFGISDPYLYGGSFMVLSMSIHLAHSYTTTNADLEQQLVRVRELSERTIAQERAVREEEVRRRIIEADNERKTEELEEARNLQLSMIPGELPHSAHWEIAASMEVATEVGGDYYDFRVEKEGLLVAIGDAVGHGMRSGIIVAATKALFATVREDEPVSQALARFDEVLRSMRLRRAHMCLMLVRLRPGKAEIVNAGMPPPLLRSTSGVSEIEILGPPLGVREPGPRSSRAVTLGSGDLLLLLSDGVPEAGREGSDEILGYDSVRQILCGSNGRPEALISGISATVSRHLDSSPPRDDMTIVAIRAR